MASSFIYHCVILLVVLISCIVRPTESRQRDKDKDRKHDKSNQYLATSMLTTPGNVNLCAKNRDVKIVCHCTPDLAPSTAKLADCWIFQADLVKKDWLAFHTQTNIEELRLTVQTNGLLSYVPTEALKLLHKLKMLTIEYGQITDLSAYLLANLTHLQNVSLAKNQIKVLQRFAIANLPVLEELNLESNQVTEIDREAFVNLPNFIRLNLSKNNLTTLHEAVFEELSSLIDLHLQSNALVVLTREIFKGLGNLKLLDLSYNNINFIGDTVFAELWSLQELCLDNNEIEKISERAFDGLNNLKKLYLNNNKLVLLERGVFSQISALTTLNLADNALETITYNNVLPLMDNLVNHTSLLVLMDNKFVCDCRLSWMFDLKNRTKNDELRTVLNEMKCTLDIDQSNLFNNALDNSIKNSHLNVANDGDYSDDQEANEIVNLFHLGIERLPCPEELSDPTEQPMSRESIGMDLSWRSHSTRIYQSLSAMVVVAVTLLLAV